MARDTVRGHALADACRSLQTRAENAKSELVADATKAFGDRPFVKCASLTEIRKHLARIRAHHDAIAALIERFHPMKRNC